MLRLLYKTPHFPMPIVTQRLLMRPPQLSDTAALNSATLESFDGLYRFMTWVKKPPTLQDSTLYIKSCMINWIKKKNKNPFLPTFIFDKNTNEFIGVAEFHHYDWFKRTIEIGYWIRTSRSGSGLMTEAIKAYTNYALTILKVKCITIACDPDNIKSRRIPERLGYTLETIHINNRLKPDTNKPGSTLIFTKYNNVGYF